MLSPYSLRKYKPAERGVQQVDVTASLILDLSSLNAVFGMGTGVPDV